MVESGDLSATGSVDDVFADSTQWTIAVDFVGSVDEQRKAEVTDLNVRTLAPMMITAN